MFLLLQIKITYFQLFLIGLAVGAVLGLIPLILGIYKKNTKLALLGFVCSILGGAISSIVSLIVVIVFIWLILRGSNAIGFKQTKTTGHIISISLGVATGTLVMKIIGLGGAIPVGIACLIGAGIGEMIYFTIVASKTETQISSENSEAIDVNDVNEDPNNVNAGNE